MFKLRSYIRHRTRRFKAYWREAFVSAISIYRRIDHSGCNALIQQQQRIIANYGNSNLHLNARLVEQHNINLEKQQQVYELQQKLTLHWKHKVTEEGWYWCKFPEREKMVVVGVIKYEGEFICGYAQYCDEMNALWAGPLPRPS